MSEIVTEKANIKTHKDLDVWKKSMDLVEEVYRFTQGFPDREKYGLIKYLKSKLTELNESLLFHRPLIKIFNEHLSLINNKPYIFCPIT